MNRLRYPTRRQACDVFRGDPFKIQSYNFRYADKPCYLPQDYQRPTPPPPSVQTFYVNPKFDRNAELSPLNRSRPRFLQEFQSVLTPPLRTPVARQPSVPVSPQLRCPSGVTDSPLLRTCCQSGEYLTLRGGQSISTLGSASSSSMRATAGGHQRISDTTFTLSSNDELPRAKRDTSSGCEININICSSLDTESEPDNNVSIRIEADASLLNNKDTVRPESQKTTRRSDASLGLPFGIDKRLSKFNVTETKPRTSPEWELQQRQRELARERNRQMRKELELERERELQEERQRARQRERERELLRQQERQRDLEHLQKLEAVRERHRLWELERERYGLRDFHRLCVLQEQLQRDQLEHVRAVSQPQPEEPMSTPLPEVPMTSHLYTVGSDDRLPGMAFCDLSSRRLQRETNPRRSLKVIQAVPVVQEMPTVCASTSAPTEKPISLRNPSARSSRNTSPRPSRNPSPRPSRNPSPRPSRKPSSSPCSPKCRSPSPDQNTHPNPILNRSKPSQSLIRSETPTTPKNLDRRSSCSSNGHVHVTVKSSGAYMTKISSVLPMNESKQLNGRPPILTRLNNMPIRITTSGQAERQLDFTMNHIRVQESSAREADLRRQDACQVNINLCSDRQRMRRI